jgi:hypothetical protein
MKKFLLMSVLALPFVAASQQEASAWHSFKFGAGINLEGSGGGNSYFWGAMKSQQPPAPGGYGPGFPGAAPTGAPGYGPVMGSPIGAFGGPGYDIGSEIPTPSATAEPPAALPSGVNKAGYWYPGLQPVGYYPAPGYYYGR